MTATTTKQLSLLFIDPSFDQNNNAAQAERFHPDSALKTGSALMI